MNIRKKIFLICRVTLFWVGAALLLFPANPQQPESREKIKTYIEWIETNKDKNPQKAIKYGQVALELLKRSSDPQNRVDVLKRTARIYWVYSEIYSTLKDYKNSLDYYKKYKDIDDSVSDEISRNKIREAQTRYNLKKKEREIALLTKDTYIRKLMVEKQKNLTISFVIISFFLLMTALAIYARYRLKIKTNRRLQEEILEHKQTAQKLVESEEQFRTLAERSVAGIFIVRDGIFQYVNPRFLNIFGYTEEEITGISPMKLVVEEDRPKVESELDRWLSGSTEEYGFEFRGITKEGQIKHLESYGTRTNFQGSPATLETIIDITDRKRLETEFIKSQKLESIGILADGIASDFNKLLSIIIGNLTLILDDKKNEQTPAVGFLKSAEKTALQASELVEKLLTFSRGGWASPQKIEFSTILENTLDVYPEMKSIIRSISINPGLKPICVDEWQIRQVLSSLLSNANESMTDPKIVKIDAENIDVKPENPFSLKPGEYVKVSVTDNGRGIPADRLEKIFDPYFSTKDTVTQKGMGLGLAICYSILKKHNGHIYIESREGKGARVDLYIPAYELT